MLRVSIITVCLNAEKTIESTIQSVLGQSYPNIQYIIIDGESSDKTMGIVNRYSESISVIVSERDAGLYDAINKGIMHADGDIIGTLNADDVLANKDIITKITEVFTKDEALKSVIGDIAFVNKKNKPSRYYSSRNWRPSLFRFGMMPPHPSFYCRRTLFSEYGFYRTDFKIGADYELLLRFFYVHKISFMILPMVFVLMRSGGVSTRGLSSFKTINKDIMAASRLNNLKTNYVLIFSRYLFRIFQFIPFKTLRGI